MLDHFLQITFDLRNPVCVSRIDHIYDTMNKSEVAFPDLSDLCTSAQVVDFDGKLVYLLHLNVRKSNSWHRIIDRTCV